MAKRTQTTTSTKAKASDPERKDNRYARAAKVLAKNERIDVKTLADRAFMSETTAARCLEAWQACVAALIEVGRLPDPEKAPAAKKAPAKPKPVVKPAPTEKLSETPAAAVETTATPTENG
jgi:hypothetical protein